MNIYNAVDGELLVSYSKVVRGSVVDDRYQLINKLMRKASRRIAYTKTNAKAVKNKSGLVPKIK